MSDYILTDGVLCHYGVLGQKWGVRRYQNEDGSLTEAGRKHYNSMLSSVKSDKNYKKAVRELNKGETAAAQTRGVIKSIEEKRDKLAAKGKNVDKYESKLATLRKSEKNEFETINYARRFISDMYDKDIDYTRNILYTYQSKYAMGYDTTRFVPKNSGIKTREGLPDTYVKSKVKAADIAGTALLGPVGGFIAGLSAARVDNMKIKNDAK